MLERENVKKKMYRIWWFNLPFRHNCNTKEYNVLENIVEEQVTSGVALEKGRRVGNTVSRCND